MTKEEAIHEIEKVFEPAFVNYIITALTEGATSSDEDQQPCEDTISRTELLTKIDEERKHLLDLKMDGAEHIIVHHARRIIEDMPSVTPQQTSWIPVSERLPEKEGYYLTTTMYHEVFCDYWNKERFERTETIIAWMPLPLSYQGK